MDVEINDRVDSRGIVSAANRGKKIGTRFHRILRLIESNPRFTQTDIVYLHVFRIKPIKSTILNKHCAQNGVFIPTPPSVYGNPRSIVKK